MSSPPVQVPESFPVTVILPSGETVAVDGRVGKIIEWAIQERDRIETMPFGSMTLDIGPNSFQPKLERVFPRVDARASPEQVVNSRSRSYNARAKRPT